MEKRSVRTLLALTLAVFSFRAGAAGLQDGGRSYQPIRLPGLKPGAGLPTGFTVPVLETGSPGPAGFATGFAVPVLATGSTATGLAVPVLETGKGGGKAGAPAAVEEAGVGAGK